MFRLSRYPDKKVAVRPKYSTYSDWFLVHPKTLLEGSWDLVSKVISSL